MRIVLCIGVAVCVHLCLMSMEHNYEDSTTTYLHTLCTRVLDKKISDTEKIGQRISIRQCLKTLVAWSNVSHKKALDYIDHQQPETKILLCEAAKLLTINGGSLPFRKIATLQLNEDVEKLIARQVVADEVRLSLTGCYQCPVNDSSSRFITDSGYLLNLQITNKPKQRRKLTCYHLQKGLLQNKKIVSRKAECFIINGFNPYACTSEERKALYAHSDWPHRYLHQNVALPCGKNVLLPGGNKVMIVNRLPLTISKEFVLDEQVLNVYPSMQSNVLLQVGRQVQLLSLEGNLIFREPRQYDKSGSILALQLANGKVIIVRGFKDAASRSFFNICWQNCMIYNPTEQPIVPHKTNIQGYTVPLRLVAAGTDMFCLVHEGGLELVDTLSNKIKFIQLPKSFNASLCDVANFGENIALIDTGHLLLFHNTGVLRQKIYFNFFDNSFVIFYQSVCHNNKGLALHQEARSTDGTLCNVLSMFKAEPPLVDTLEEAHRLISGKCFYTELLHLKKSTPLNHGSRYYSAQ